MNTLSSAGPGSPLCCLSGTVGPPQMGRHSLLLPQGAVLPAPPSKCCLQHPLPPLIAILYLASAGAWLVTYKVQPRPHPQLQGLSTDLIFIQD